MHQHASKQLVAACTMSLAITFQANAQQPEPVSEDDIKMRVQAAKATTMEFVQGLGTTMKQEIQTGGPAAAIKVCRDVAPAKANEISLARGWKVTRVGTRVRNPMIGMPDAWEQQVLQKFSAQVEQGGKPADLVHYEVVQEPDGRYLRFMKAIGTQPLCLACHGARDNIADSVKAGLQDSYPHDRAVGYAAGDLRGAVSIKQPLDQ